MIIFKSHPSLNLSYLYNFGTLLAFCLIIQIATGVTIAMHYNPSVLEAFISVEHVMCDVNNGWLLRFLYSNIAITFFTSAWLICITNFSLRFTRKILFLLLRFLIVRLEIFLINLALIIFYPFYLLFRLGSTLKKIYDIFSFWCLKSYLLQPYLLYIFNILVYILVVILLNFDLVYLSDSFLDDYWIDMNINDMLNPTNINPNASGPTGGAGGPGGGGPSGGPGPETLAAGAQATSSKDNNTNQRVLSWLATSSHDNYTDTDAGVTDPLSVNNLTREEATYLCDKLYENRSSGGHGGNARSLNEANISDLESCRILKFLSVHSRSSKIYKYIDEIQTVEGASRKMINDDPFRQILARAIKKL